MKRVDIYVRRGVWLVSASSRTTDGVWIADVPSKIDDGASPADKGRVVLEALMRSRSQIPHPKSWKGHMDGLLSAAGVKSWAAFSKHAKAISIEQAVADGQIVIIPCRNDGGGDGYRLIQERAISTRADSDEEFGRCLERALLLAE